MQARVSKEHQAEISGSYVVLTHRPIGLQTHQPLIKPMSREPLMQIQTRRSNVSI